MTVHINGRSLQGNLTDNVTVPFLPGRNRILEHLNTAYYHVHGEGFTYPDHADNVVLTSGAGIWSETGAIIEVIPTGVLSLSNFDLHWINVSNILANGQLQIDIFKGGVGSETRVFAARVHRNAVQSQEGSKRIHVPQLIAGERISCRIRESIGVRPELEPHTRKLC